jgi:two-component system chemotaxis response regulator CheB
VLKELQKKSFQGEVIMISSHTVRGAPLTIEALELGAFDFILKPSLPSLQENFAALRGMFQPKIQVIAHRKKISKLLHGGASAPRMTRKPTAFSGEYIPKPTPQIVAIGVSTGGPKALAKIIPDLPPDLPVPILIVQHMPQGFTAEFAKSLNEKSQITVKEGEDGETIRKGTAYIAPGGTHMKIRKGSSGKIIRITDDPPENNCKPSVDYCFRSVCEIYGKHTLAVVLTGMGRDGATGSQQLQKSGAQIIVQDEATSVVFGMPKAVIDAGVADKIYPLQKMSSVISQIVGGH